ncbi:hypothetical protein [Asticcacaulis sp. AC402]|uniref:glucuronyl esterase domain-containing protein n=1 Tax=Asticcacaulis sp. AC402 TaxID=1282361 RepID=UPI0003C3D2B5|nr:hypothetical protein [Asticcacaulis sp. AC402]ESQ74784.1 hypothetical protein ABAC402_12830 [Asticcacaulis sp. AC402]
MVDNKNSNRPGGARLLWKILRWLSLVIVVGAAVGLRVGYAQIFPKVDDEIGQPVASPPVLDAFGADPRVTSVADWERRRPQLETAFATHLYGDMPPQMETTVLARESFAKPLAPSTRLDQLTLGFGSEGTRGKANVLLIRPAPEVKLRGLIVMQTFCGNAAAGHYRNPAVQSLAAAPKFCKGPMSALSHIILGKYPSAPPYALVTARGYAIAIVYAPDLVPDEAATSGPALERLYGRDYKTSSRPGGALAAWAWLYAQTGRALGQEPGLEGVPVIAWGHSRNGKAALLAGAVYPEISGVIAHQSGKGGTTLTRSHLGESVKQITDSYGYWFTPAYARFAGNEAAIPVDQHQLIALNAPKPVLIGTGDRDKWSDPPGSFRAAQGASPVYELYGFKPFDQTALTAFDATRRVAFFMRAGTHGVTTQDWNLMLAFLDAHFPARP